MIKIHPDFPTDRYKLEAELGKDLDQLSEIEASSFMTDRKKEIMKVVSISKSTAGRLGYIKNKSKVKQATARFKRSMKGKKVQRNATRTLLTKTPNKIPAAEALMILASTKTHLLLERNYTLPLTIAAELTLLLEEALQCLTEAEMDIIKTGTVSLNPDCMELLTDFYSSATGQDKTTDYGESTPQEHGE